jgi:hypothetical protein
LPNHINDYLRERYYRQVAPADGDDWDYDYDIDARYEHDEEDTEAGNEPP